MRNNIAKLAIKTISRTSFSVILFCIIGQTLLFYSLNGLSTLYRTNDIPFQITATTTNPVELDSLLKIDGVSKITPIITSSGILSLNSTEVNVELYAVFPSYIKQHNIQGTVFPDNSNMPYLLINNAVVKELESNDIENSYLLSNAAHCKLYLENEFTSLICGIIDDKSDSPKVYMSFHTAKSIISTYNSQDIWIDLSNIYNNKRVCGELTELGFNVKFDQQRVNSWFNQRYQTILTIISGLGFILCVIFISFKEYQIEQFIHFNQQQTLLSSGFSKKSLHYIYVGRFFLIIVLCLLCSSLLAWWFTYFCFFGFCIMFLFTMFCTLSLYFITLKIKVLDYNHQ